MLLTNYTPNLENLFKIGEEIIIYDSPEDLLRKIEIYTSDDDLRNMIANNGKNRSINNHSYDSRSKNLLKLIGA